MRSAFKIREQIVAWQGRVAAAIASGENVPPESPLYARRHEQTVRLEGVKACLQDVLRFIDAEPAR